MKVKMYIQLGSNNKDFNNKRIQGLDNVYLWASTQQPFESRELDTLCLEVDIPDRYFKANTKGTIYGDIVEVKEAKGYE